MSQITQLDEGLYCIDLNFQGRSGIIASYLIEDSGERALIETGPTSTLDALLEGLRDLNVDPATITKVLVTHIHLDHAGASGTIMRRFPQTRLYVHEIGAPHLVNPAQLLKSATRIYGNMMGQLWGAVEPVPVDRMITLTTDNTIEVGKRRLTAVYTPGHASHHVIFHEPERGGIFTGDVASVRLQGMRFVRPATPPPDIDLELWSQSIDTMRELAPRTLYLTHFGPSTDVAWHLQEANDHLYQWAEIVRRAQESGQDRPAIVDTLRLHGDGELLKLTNDASMVERYELSTPYGMSVDGYLRYFRKRARQSTAAGG